MAETLQASAASVAGAASAGAASECLIRNSVSDYGKLRFSIIIANYNYARFVHRAIASALALDWPNVEVIVIDDGSTDGSVGVIRGFGSRIVFRSQANAGQRVANNLGFTLAGGDVVVFLDADDVLRPAFAREVAAAWQPGISKVQVQMIHVDAQERPLGRILPEISQAPGPGQIRSWAMGSTEYPTPPGSGNAYSREFLENFFPIGPEHDSSTDSTCLALAPLLGNVITVLKPLVLYRQHGENDSNLLAKPGRFAREVSRAMVRQATVEAVLARLGQPTPPAGRLRRSRHLLQLRIASLRLSPDEHPLPGDGRLIALWDSVRCLFGPGFYSLRRRLLVTSWAICTLLGPRSLARWLVSFRFGSRSLVGSRSLAPAWTIPPRQGQVLASAHK